jgi:hypothetical protein
MDINAAASVLLVSFILAALMFRSNNGYLNILAMLLYSFGFIQFGYVSQLYQFYVLGVLNFISIIVIIIKAVIEARKDAENA